MKNYLTRTLKSFIKSDHELALDAAKQGELERAETTLENSDLDRDLEEYKQEAFSDKLEKHNYRNAAEYSLEVNLDQEWVKDQARTSANLWLVRDEIRDNYKASRVGELVECFNIQPDVHTGNLDLVAQRQIPEETAEKRLVNEIVQKKSPDYINMDKIGIPYPEFTDPEEVRKNIENRELGEGKQVETKLADYSQDADIYDKLDIEWVKTGELEKLLNQDDYR